MTVSLAAIEAADKAATRAPWKAFEAEDWWEVYHTDHATDRMALDGFLGDRHVTELVGERPDAELIALYRNETPALARALRAVLALSDSGQWFTFDDPDVDPDEQFVRVSDIRKAIIDAGVTE